MKKFFKILSCFMLIFTFANAKDFTKDTLIVGTNATYPPFEFLDDKSEVLILILWLNSANESVLNMKF